MQHSGANPLARARSIAAVMSVAIVALLAAHVRAAYAAPIPVGVWNLDEPGGQAALDAGPFGLHGVLGSTMEADGDDPARVAGASGGALRFAGDDRVQIVDQGRLNLPSLTVEVVARAGASPGAYRYLVAHRSRACFSGAFGLYTAANGGLAFYVFDGERYFISASATPSSVWDGGWHRLTGSFDGRRVRAFLDGREIGTAFTTPVGTAIEYASMTGGTYFGSYGGSCSLPFVGDLDSVRVWSEALSPAAVATQSNLAPGAAAAVPAGAPATTIAASAPKASCAVRAGRPRKLSRRRAVVVVRAVGKGGPLRRVRLHVRHAKGRKVIAAPRTNAKGSARLVLATSPRRRLRVSVAGRPSCTPAFITIGRRR